MKCSAFFVFTIAAVLFGCTASPVHYHTLASTDAFERSGQVRAGFLLKVMPVKVPPSLDQAYLAIRKGKTEVVFVDDERWASPLGNEIGAALSARLAFRLNTDDVADFSLSSNKPVATLKVEIRQLDVWPGSRVQLAAGWQAVVSDHGDRALSCVTHLQETVTAEDYDSLVQAQQAVILKLADIIGANVIALEKSAQTGCGSMS